MKYKAMFGRYQPWHDGHAWLLDELLEDPSTAVWIGVRSVSVDERNPYHPTQVVENIKAWLVENRQADYLRCHVAIIPDISGVHYGRGVGWEIVEHVPPDAIGAISATTIRAGRNDET